MNTHLRFLRIAVEASANTINGSPPVGAVVTLNNLIISIRCNKIDALGFMHHAELLAIQEARSKIGTHLLAHCTLYSSLEPCLLCLAYAHKSKIKKIFYACKGRIGFNDCVMRYWRNRVILFAINDADLINRVNHLLIMHFRTRRAKIRCSG